MKSNYSSEEILDIHSGEGDTIDPETLSTETPAIGIRVTPETDPDHLAGAVLRARRMGHDPLVYSSTELSSEATSVVDQLDVAALTLEDDRRSDPVDRVTGFARDTGYPGVLLQTDPSSTVDFESSVASLTASSQYATEVEVASTDPSTCRVVVGIPAYNEEVGIGSVVLGAKRYADEVVVVDDGSTDRTVQIAREAGASVIEHDENQGKGAAMQTLFDQVESKGCDVLVTIDGDGQHAPDEIEDVVQPVLAGEADVVIGSRYAETDGTNETPLYRRFGQKVLDTLTLGSSGRQLSDTQSGFRAFSSAAVEQLSIETTGMGVESEQISQASKLGLEIHEVPIDIRYDVENGQTHNPVWHGLEVVNFLLGMVRDRHPLLFFALPGVLLALFGALYGLQGILIYQNTGVFYPVKVLVSGFAMVLGILGVFTGLVLNQMAHMMGSTDAGE